MSNLNVALVLILILHFGNSFKGIYDGKPLFNYSKNTNVGFTETTHKSLQILALLSSAVKTGI